MCGRAVTRVSAFAGMVQTCLRLSMQPRFSSLLRRMAEQAVIDMVCVVFGRHIAPLASDGGGGGATVDGGVAARPSDLAPGQRLTDDEILERILTQITESERPEVENNVSGVVNTQRVQFAKETNTVKKMLESGLSVCCKLFKASDGLA